jgi:hypothetical protein
MACNAFRSIGGITFKYYMFFQHRMAPPSLPCPRETIADLDSNDEQQAATPGHYGEQCEDECVASEEL